MGHAGGVAGGFSPSSGSPGSDDPRRLRRRQGAARRGRRPSRRNRRGGGLPSSDGRGRLDADRGPGNRRHSAGPSSAGGGSARPSPRTLPLRGAADRRQAPTRRPSAPTRRADAADCAVARGGAFVSGGVQAAARRRVASDLSCPQSRRAAAGRRGGPRRGAGRRDRPVLRSGPGGERRLSDRSRPPPRPAGRGAAPLDGRPIPLPGGISAAAAGPRRPRDADCCAGRGRG